MLHFLHSLITTHFDCIDCHQHLFRLSLWLPCWPNQSGNSWHRAYIPLLWAFWILDAIVLRYIGFNVCHAIIFTDIWIMQVPIPVKPMFGVWNAFRGGILINFDWMTVDSSDWAGIQYLSLSSREVLYRQSGLERRYFWQCKCSRTIMLKEWPGCVHNLFLDRNVSYRGYQLALCTRFLLGNM